jgi:HlyD family secretion protein
MVWEDKMKKKKLFIVILVIAGIVLIGYNLLKPSGDKGFKAVIEVVEQGEIKSFVTANGVVEENSVSMVDTDSRVKVTKLLKSEFDSVKKNEKVLEFDLSTLRDELLKLELAKKNQEFSLTKLKNSAGMQNLSALYNAVKLAENNLEMAKRSYESAKSNYNKIEEMYKNEAATKSELDSANKILLDSKSAMDNAAINLENAETSLEDANKQNNRSSENINLDIESLENNIKTTEIAIKNMESTISKLEQKQFSPKAGTISGLYVTEGDFTTPGRQVYTVTGDDIQIRAFISEYNIKNIKIGQEVEVTGEAIPDDKEIKGKLIKTGAKAYMKSGTGGAETVIDIIIEIVSEQSILKPGLNVNCNINTYNKSDALKVNMEALNEDRDGKQFCFIADDDNIAKKVYVKLGLNSDFYVEVLEGLKSGDRVIINPLPVLKDGDRVVIKEEKNGAKLDGDTKDEDDNSKSEIKTGDK